MRIERFDPASDAGADAWVTTQRDFLTEAWPEGLLPSPEYLVGRVRHKSDGKTDHLFLAYDGDGVAGGAEVSWWEFPDNRDRAWVELAIPAERCSEEVLRALLGAAGEVMRADGRDLVTADLPQGHPAGKWLESRGGRRGSVEEHNVCRLASLDRSDIEALATTAPDGYELVAFDGACPDDLLEPFTELNRTMNDAPRDDLTMDDWSYSPERIRDFELGLERRGHTMLQVVARSTATGELAGFNQVVVHPEWPEVIDNEDTAVAVAHRGHGIGLWIKAANLLRVMDDFPALAVETWNAASNAHMLRVNRRLGFVCEHVWESWEIGLSEAEAP